MALGALPLAVVAVFAGLYWSAGPLWWGLGLLATGVFAILVWQFFRIPHRTPNQDDGAIVSPCDGKVVTIEDIHEHEAIDAPAKQISIFMSPLNVHANYYPVEGEVTYSKYHPGLFLVAWHPKSSIENERTTMVVKHPKGNVLFRQIAGAVARRIVCYATPGEQVGQNQECGFIKFGSRVDVIVPREVEVTVKIGDKVKGRITELARWT